MEVERIKLSSELDKLLIRCPRLLYNPAFSVLVQKGKAVEDEELVNALVGVFVHPDYTIQILGCFRHMGKKIMNKVIRQLQLVLGSTSKSEFGIKGFEECGILKGCESFDHAKAASLIEFYSEKGKVLDLHEFASFAFCRVLELAPFLKGCVKGYYKFAPSPFVRIEKANGISLSHKAFRDMLLIFQISYRFLLADPEYYKSIWDWSFLLKLLQQFENVHADDNEYMNGISDDSREINVSKETNVFEVTKVSKDIRWIGTQILSVVLNVPNNPVPISGLTAKEALACFLRWQEFCSDVSLEKAEWYTYQKVNSECTAGDARSVTFPSAELADIDLPQSSGSFTKGGGSHFVMTSAIKKSFERVVLAVNQKWPVLLYGPSGCGKTALINKLAQESGNQVLSIHMDEQIDGRTLVGSYVCTEQPGEFRWQPGSLTQAVANGLWVVFENIDQAPSDVHSILLPLLEAHNSFATGHGEAVQVAQSFRLFSTITSSKLDASNSFEGRKTLSSLWRRIMIRLPSREDLNDMVTALYPDLETIVSNILGVSLAVNKPCVSGAVESLDSLERFSLRDILKFCKRISSLGLSFGKNNWTHLMWSRICLEAVDIFACSFASAQMQMSVMETISKMLNVPISALIFVNKPSYQDFGSDVQIGRVTLERSKVDHQEKCFVHLQSSLLLLERVACSVKYNEPVLLVGETGTGKTTLVQSLAMKLGKKLTVLNLSQQSDVSDLLGGFKPVDARSICIPLYKEFMERFCGSSLDKKHPNHVNKFQMCFKKNNWKQLLVMLKKDAQTIKDTKIRHGVKRKRDLEKEHGVKQKRDLEKDLIFWQKMFVKLENALRQLTTSSGMMFKFVEGAFITALQKGEWILLDEVNLAPPETLSRILGVLDGERGSLCLAERGDIENIVRHPSFRIFACMNPANDAGKRDLPCSLRSRFTEYFVDDVLGVEDLTQFVNRFNDDIFHSSPGLVDKIVQFYIAAKQDSETSLLDGANQKPQYSLRSLYRALEYTRKTMGSFAFQQALYDAFCMFFMSSLEEESAKKMGEMIVKYLLEGKTPANTTFHRYLRIKSDSPPGNFVLTKSVRKNLRNIARAVFIKRYPVLLQGPTSSGKTSMVQYLAAITGHEFVRINNHEHTDLQEYTGSYITDATGKLVFQEGVLVKALRNGHWIVLDELNLAPTDVLEALNRLLDDNRELFVPELFETVRPHPDFMLFATQNPPTFYGGRKMLSRAFRNRFVEIHVDGIPEDELSTILFERCHIPKSYANKMVDVMKDLQLRRQTSKAFAGKHGFITPRDLLRWAERVNKSEMSYTDLAVCGYHLLGERLRDDTEKKDVQEVLISRLLGNKQRDDTKKKDIQVDLTSVLYKQELPGTLSRGISDSSIGNIIWTKSMSRLYYLVERCYQMREPVLLVGETGAGKTTVCQLLSMILQSKLHILNCHQYTETSDFIGGFYPIRERSTLVSEFKSLIQKLLLKKLFTLYQEDAALSEDINKAPSTLDKLDKILSMYRESLGKFSAASEQDLSDCAEKRDELSNLYQKWQTIFMWQDGPLVHAMKDGSLFLVDEISLADDSVLERLNSVLEPERKLSLPEKGGTDMEIIKAHPNFFLLATMNPGGDYGKKELSPALRNRFTEIWVPPVIDMEELGTIAADKFSSPELSCKLLSPLLEFWKWFNKLQTGRTLTVRDLLSWVAFVNTSERCLTPEMAFLHGAFLVLLDGLTLGTGLSEHESTDLRKKCFNFLVEELQRESELDPKLLLMANYGWGYTTLHKDVSGSSDMQCDNLFGMDPFYIQRGNYVSNAGGFELLAPTTRRNVFRILRAMQLSKPVLLEGSPGVGKTSLIVALGNFSGHKVVRINLSEQTDLMDLLGSDLPIESDEGIQFAWSDGILLQALKEGSWVLLDELNLAPQSVLEGLNAILDHRAEVFIPELGCTFKCPPSFRVFACQNPTYQGGGRKGLPKSFLNRFTKVYVDQLNEDDYLAICSSLFPEISNSLLSKLISFNKRLYEEIMLYHKFAQDGSPWEFNLRDVIRSCQIIKDAPNELKNFCFLNAVYIQRMRTAADRREVLGLYEQVFEVKPFLNPYPRVQLNDHFLAVGRTQIKRNIFYSTKTVCHELKILPEIRNMLEAAAQCVQQGWLCILVGPASSGKTSLVRLLAQLTGNVLNEINISSATDISEMLGCFEQYNFYRNFQTLVAQVECYVTEYCHKLLSSSLDTHSAELKELVSRRLSFLSSVNLGKLARSVSTEMEWGTSLSLIVEIIEILRSDLEMNIVTSMPWSHDDLSRILQMIQKLQGIHFGRPLPVKFEWVAGSLIRAIENGEWIILEDANLCNPTVLDRINSLAESNGFITVNECGNVDGKPLTLRPHPNFRMFLTVNPTHGEVSRAMRNRGVEIFMMQPKWILEAERGYSVTEIELSDVKRFLVLSGIPNSVLVDSMAKAHIHARYKGLHLSVKISHLELARWIQLFQQFLMNGNKLMESLHSSWEHIYLTSLGESEGWDIVDQAKVSYLSIADFLSAGASPVMPGGWPLPLSLRDFIMYSKEACVRQNCMYVEFLGSQYASYQYSKSENHFLNAPDFSKKSKSVYLIDTKILQATMRNKGLQDAVCNFSGREFDTVLATKMLLYAANWIVEQATESDLDLYTLWLSWYDSHLQPYCDFFSSFLLVFKQELERPIWKRILKIRHKVAVQVKASDPDLDVQLNLLPLLAMESVDLMVSKHMPISAARIMSNSMNCVGLLRRTLWQWDAEKKHEYPQDYRLVLESLNKLEEKVLGQIVKSPTFDLHLQLYSDLLEEHTSFWNCVATSKDSYLPLYWRSLIKNSLKLEQYCPEAVTTLLEEGKRFTWALHSVKPLLWIHGGHPFMPGSAKVYHTLQQLFAFSQLVWPTKRISEKCDDGHGHLFDIAASSDSELRLLTMQGLCMSSHLAHENGEVKVEELEEIHQMLSERFLKEKNELKKALADSDASLSALANLASCCIMSPKIVCSQSGHNCWLENLPLVDQSTILLDLPLLQRMPEIILADASEVQFALSHLAGDMQLALDFSLNFSSRSPLDMLPYQRILWIIDAWALTSAVHSKLASSVLEMWFRWHSFLWKNLSTSAKKLQGVDAIHNNLSTEAVRNEICPYLLVTPLMTEAVHKKLENMSIVKDYYAESLKLRTISYNIWQSVAPKMNLTPSFLHSARSLLQQIIFAHRKSFSNDIYAKIKSRYPASSTPGHMVKEEEIEALILLLESSTHPKFKSLIVQMIQPLLKELYLKCSSEGPIYHIGCSWWRLGELRFHLLLGFDYLDPTAKYTCKHTRLLEKISSLELEMKIREECNYLAGSLSAGDVNGKLSLTLDSLKDELKRLEKKIVFRSEPKKFLKLKTECEEFLKMVSSAMLMVKEPINFEVDQLVEIVDRAKSLQAAANAFIDRLSDDFTGYDDLIQPFQVAVYEMKFGLSLIVSSILENGFAYRLHEDSLDPVMNMLCSFMRFPRECGFKTSMEVRMMPSEFPSCTIAYSGHDWVENMRIAMKFLKDSIVVGAGKMVSPTLCEDIVGRVVSLVANRRVVDHETFTVLNELYADFASIWMKMKVEEETTKSSRNEGYLFKPRAFKIEDIYEFDLSTLKGSFSSSSFAEWNEALRGDDMEMKGSVDEPEALKMWKAIEESALRKMVATHNELFGSINLNKDPGIIEVSDAQKLVAFIDSYTIGADVLRDLKGISASYLDAKLGPEHLLRLCLGNEWPLTFPGSSVHILNFYKDSNSNVLGSMVKLLTALQRQVLDLLSKWEEHPGLEKILDIVEMLLCIPLNTPLAKALSGLQFLYSKVKMLEEEGSKFPLNDQLEPILALASSWQKMEFESWRMVLSEADHQFEMNAAKLWFPLYSVLHPISSAEMSEDDHVKSLVEFIETSNVGEFRRRLQLVLAFYGHVTAGLRLKSYTSPFQLENQKILFNLFGCYIQFLPVIMEHITTNRKNVEKKLEQLLKLSKWNYRLLPLEDSRRNRQKLKKIMHEYTEILQQPVMLILQQKCAESGTRTQYPSNMSQKKQDALTTACGLPHFNDAERLTSHFRDACDLPDPWYRAVWLADWQKKADHALQIMHSESKNPDICFKEDVLEQLPFFKSPCLSYQEGWNQVWRTLQGFYVTAVDTSEKWNMEGKNPEKMRALGDLMKLLESSGLAKHKFAFQEDIQKHSESTWWLFMPSYDVKHLLLKHDGFTCEEVDFPVSEGLQCLTLEVFEEEWKIANQFYFKSLASVRGLINLSVNFDQEQVGKSRSFLSQMVVIEQDQRQTAYSFSERIIRLSDVTLCLKNICSFFKCSSQETADQSFPISSQHGVIQCLWKQKVLFDTLCGLSQEEALLLKIVERTHLSSCQSVKPAANQIVSLLEKFAPRFRKSKALLDGHLLGNRKAGVKLATSVHPVIVSKEMEQLITENFEVLKEFKGLYSDVAEGNQISIVQTLLGHFEDVTNKGKEVEEEYSNKEVGYDSKRELLYENELNSFLDNTFGYLMDAFKGLRSLNDRPPTDISWENITLWRTLFESYIEDLHLNLVYDELVKTVSILYAGKLTTIPKRCANVLVQIHSLLDLILSFCNGLLHDFLAVHKTVAIVTHKLAETFTTLFSKGYQKSTEDVEDESGDGMTKDATGTGMGEGSGVKDVSDQITDEDQLLGTSGKKEEEEGLDQMPSKNNKGIEMGEDFEGDTFDVSEDSAAEDEEDEDDEPDQLDNEMGKTGDDGEIADEKLWNKEEDEKPENADEKLESGPSVKDKDPSNRELRGKEDSAAATDELDGTSPDKDGEKDEMGQDDDGDLENTGDEMNVEKNDALPDIEGLDLSEPFKDPEEDAEMELDEQEDPVDEGEAEENDELVDHGDAEEMHDDAPNEEGESSQLGETEKNGDSKNDDEGDEQMDLTDHKNDMPLQGNPELNDELLQDKDAPHKPIENFQGASTSTAQEVKWSAGSGNQNDFAPSDANEELGIQLGNSNGDKLANDQPKSEGPQKDSASLQKNQPNPLRNVGDALEGWKERVKVSTDVQDDNRDGGDDLMDDDADEYGFTSELDKGTAQAQGPAMADQTEQSINGDRPDEDRTAIHEDNTVDMETDYPNQHVEAQAMMNHVNIRNRAQEQIRPSPENLPEEEAPGDVNVDDDDDGLIDRPMENIVAVERALMREVNEVPSMPHQQRTVDNNHVEAPIDINNATALWRKYEFQTTRLSQELAEQLRLVMEPTLASKLMGDYRTGKRINMKKVIPYVASHYRKDKIWLRRTRPNKRDYQVVVAVDDSRSMLESGCGDVAIEALVTVCRAMSQLEVGKMAVTSFGKEGNVRLLHDFDQPFTGEAGVKMVSSLTFKQENHIDDVPMVDLLSYLNRMLDDAAVNARLPSGQNPLQQLVLIIADGHLTEMGKLTRYVRELTNQKRMIAFLMLDDFKNPMMDRQEATFDGGQVKIKKYLDKFPFPYYIILKDIEALPRTLADLLRQWFEVMQNTRD